MLLDFAPFQKQFYKVFFEFKVIAIVLHFALFKNYFKKFSAKVFLWVLSHCHFYSFFVTYLQSLLPKKCSEFWVIVILLHFAFFKNNFTMFSAEVFSASFEPLLPFPPVGPQRQKVEADLIILKLHQPKQM